MVIGPSPHSPGQPQRVCTAIVTEVTGPSPYSLGAATAKARGKPIAMGSHRVKVFSLVSASIICFLYLILLQSDHAYELRIRGSTSYHIRGSMGSHIRGSTCPNGTVEGLCIAFVYFLILFPFHLIPSLICLFAHRGRLG